MTDRELLERAARAAGITVRWERDPSMPFQERWCAMVPAGWVGQPTEVEWNPLTDDGDALRLAVKLNLVLSPSQVSVMAWCPGAVSRDEVWEKLGDEPCAATRRAITRAAAAMAPEEKP